MEATSPRILPQHQPVQTYCSQSRTAPPSFRTIEDGVRIIEEILKKNVLCRHDVEDINQTFQAIDLLERQVEQISEVTSQNALQKIIDKVKKIALDEKITPGALISLYHLQNFSDKEMPINGCFINLLRKYDKAPKNIEEVASHLPCCISETLFEEDVKGLIGSNSSEQVTHILKRKKEKLQNHDHTMQEIASRRSELTRQRISEPQKYPPYLDELLDSGYLHLFDHLVQMRALSSRNNRRSAIEKMTFSQLSHVVLETRDAVIKKVKSSIPAGCHNLVFLLGGTGSGKSTALCFLRGDKMVKKDINYESQSDNNGLIGHEGAFSCTFLPTTEVVNDLAIVDFPGFDDTNGQFISLGMEFALKALIKNYQPKILVLEAITNNEGRFAAAAQLGNRLTRLLDNKKNCILGITKYLKDPHYLQIQAIEEQQKKDRLTPTAQEVKLITQIETLSDLNDAELQPKIQTLQEQLTILQLSRAEELQQPLPDTELKTESKRQVQEKENELLRQIGLGKIIRFSDLDDSHQLSSCLADLTLLSENECIHIRSEKLLDPDDRKLLDDRFADNLVKEMVAQRDYQTEFKDFKAFEQNVLEASLINTIFSQSHPEIGQLLHLPEIDPTLARKYDREIVDSCIRVIMESVIGTLNISLINKIISELGKKAPKGKVESLIKKMNRLRDYVLGLLGDLPEDKTQADKKWDAIQIQHKAAIDAIDVKFKLPAWTKILLGIPLGIPLGIHALMRWNSTSEAKLKAVEETFDTSCHDLDQMYDMLQQLNNIKKIIEKQEALDRALTSAPISLVSVGDLTASIQNRIKKVRNVYGSDDWDKRVSFLSEQISLKNIDSKNSAHIACISAYAYLLIEPDLSCICTPVKKANVKVEAGVKDRAMLKITPSGFEKESNFFKLSICKKSDHRKMIEIIGPGECPEFTQDITELQLNNRPLTRVLHAAALLKSHDQRMN